MKKLILCGLLLGFSVSGFGMDENGAYVANSAPSCGKWVAERKADSFQLDSYKWWIAGFLTAFNLRTPDTYDILGYTDLESVYLWMDNYCQENPLNDLAQGMNYLTNELYPNRTTKMPNP